MQQLSHQVKTCGNVDTVALLLHSRLHNLLLRSRNHEAVLEVPADKGAGAETTTPLSLMKRLNESS